MTFQRNIELDFEYILDSYNFLKCKSNDIMLLNNRKAE